MKTVLILAALAAAGYFIYASKKAAPPAAAVTYDSDKHPSDTTPGANAPARVSNLTGEAPPTD